ncbi:MAG: LysM peptidoglycan-binding domain-containing protein [Nitrospirae bacterium]|nr:LysM peptidoglycan-binding domain-containing protein [Nitrospirota bacterium]
MRKIEVTTISLALGSIFLLAGCSFQFQTKPVVKTTGEVIKVPAVEKAEPVEKKVVEVKKAEPVEKVPEVKEELANTHTVVKGETLWDIAGYKDVYGDPTKWKLIYEANKDILDSPDSLKPGQLLVIPRE